MRSERRRSPGCAAAGETAGRSHGRLTSDHRSLRVRLLPITLEGEMPEDARGLRKPLSAPNFARSLCRWNCHAELLLNAPCGTVAEELSSAGDVIFTPR